MLKIGRAKILTKFIDCIIGKTLILITFLFFRTWPTKVTHSALFSVPSVISNSTGLSCESMQVISAGEKLSSGCKSLKSTVNWINCDNSETGVEFIFTKKTRIYKWFLIVFTRFIESSKLLRLFKTAIYFLKGRGYLYLIQIAIFFYERSNLFLRLNLANQR